MTAAVSSTTTPATTRWDALRTAARWLGPPRIRSVHLRYIRRAGDGNVSLGRVVTNAFDAAGRISGVTGSIAPSTYASNVTYAPQGPISGLNLGSGMTEAWTFNSREQPITLKVTTTGLPLNLGWGYGAAANNNGNVQSQTISGPVSAGSPSPRTIRMMP